MLVPLIALMLVMLVAPALLAWRALRTKDHGTKAWFHRRVLRLYAQAERRMLRHQWSKETAIVTAERLQAKAEAVRSGVLEQPGWPFGWTATAAVVFGTIWSLAFGNEVAIDTVAFQQLGHPPGVALSQATLLALAFSVAGVSISDLLGLTHLFPRLARLRRPIRYAIVAYLVIAFAMTAWLVLPKLADYRSQSLADELRGLQQDLAAVEVLEGDESPLKAQLQEEVAAKSSQLETARHTDRSLVIVAAVVEAATSWAAVLLLVLLIYGGLLLAASAAKRRANQATRSLADEPTRFQEHVVTLADRHRIPPDVVQQILREFAARQLALTP